MKERFKQTSNIEEALGVLLEASHEECRVRSRARLASTLEEALDSLFVCGSSSGEEREHELNFDEFEDDQLFFIAEAGNREQSDRIREDAVRAQSQRQSCQGEPPWAE